ncbi:MAG: HlyD family efflux transporter periplasmic adaptor subunit, partial [Xanthomonadales bacterium]|nr:HlyD family efflux transporter periplasmic adaptor subunit [Xanthomonadales bacterium]
IILVLPHARSLVVRNAVTTAYLSSLNAPISGRVTEVQVAAGSVARAGESAVSLHNEKVDSSRVARLQALVDEGRAEVERLRAHLESVRGLAEARRTEMFAYTEAVNQDVGSQLQAARDRSAALQSSLREAEGNLERVRKLFADGLLSQSDLETAESIYESALADASANQLEISRLGQQLEEIQKSVFQVNVPDGALLTRQSVQQLDLEVMRLEQALGDSEARLNATSAELQQASLAYLQASTANVEVPEGQVIWNMHTTPGAWANEGSPLLTFVDCSRLLLDIAVDDATLELIEPGTQVNVRQFGSFRYHTATVILVRGSSALKSDIPVLAAEVEHRGTRKGRVLARFDTAELPDGPAKSCGIGRTAYAEFEDINLFEMLILPLFR